MSIRDDAPQYFRDQAKWRAVKGARYSDVPRSQQSADALDSLADYVLTGEADDLLGDLEPHSVIGEAMIGADAVKAETIRYGFGYAVKSHAQHRELLSDLWLACMVDAYEYTVENGEDWTGALYPCESHAAEELNPRQLPEQYWMARRGASEHETEERLASYQEARS